MMVPRSRVPESRPNVSSDFQIVVYMYVYFRIWLNNLELQKDIFEVFVKGIICYQHSSISMFLFCLQFTFVSFSLLKMGQNTSCSLRVKSLLKNLGTWSSMHLAKLVTKLFFRVLSWQIFKKDILLSNNEGFVNWVFPVLR